MDGLGIVSGTSFGSIADHSIGTKGQSACDDWHALVFWRKGGSEILLREFATRANDDLSQYKCIAVRKKVFLVFWLEMLKINN
ncbi:hypothetical protein GALL_373680 [mine drainage metagenome]|uniref:Uncharacterized protein n=1 Tax=mine drainage metagenome TaxID=410659 RepID=A0A1J5QLR5_9ZZZZ